MRVNSFPARWMGAKIAGSKTFVRVQSNQSPGDASIGHLRDVHKTSPVLNLVHANDRLVSRTRNTPRERFSQPIILLPFTDRPRISADRPQ